MTRQVDHELLNLVKLHSSLQKVQVAMIRMAEAMTEVVNATGQIIEIYAKDRQS